MEPNSPLEPNDNPLNNLTPNQRIWLVAAILGIAVVLIVVVAVGLYLVWRIARQQPPTPAPEETFANRNVRFGMPAEAKADPASKDAYLIDRPQYVLSYNDSKKIPNWVCWNLTKSDIGHTKRAPSFEPDLDLPAGFHRVKASDYTGSGFDRGHMCPSKDRSDSEENNRPLFFMTNILPQAPNCNRKGWEQLESYCRTLAENGKELYIASGPHGQGGTGEHGPRKTIGKTTQIEVPETVWKVVLVLPDKESDPTQTTRTIAVWMPNDQSVGSDWRPYIVPVADVERRTGFKFFPVVPDDVAGPIKSRADSGP